MIEVSTGHRVNNENETNALLLDTVVEELKKS